MGEVRSLNSGYGYNTQQQLEEMKRARDEVVRQAAWNDLYIFSKLVCGFDKMEEQPHREVCEILTHGIDQSAQLKIFNNKGGILPVSTKFVKETEAKLKKLLMIPRGTFKSTIATNAYPLWLLWHNPNLRIMIDSETLANAKLYLAGIKDQIANNEYLQRICVDADGKPVLVPHYKISGGFTEDQLILKTRTDLGRKEPTIFCSGADNARTGMHPDVILMDDLVSERNVGTKEQIEKVKNHYKFSLSLLEPDGLQVVIGTRYHMDDLYNDLLDYPTFECYVRPAVMGYYDDGEPVLFFPNRLTKEYLADKRVEQGSYIYSSQYMLSPLDDDNAVFKRDDIKYYNSLKDIQIEVAFMMVDLAISQKETADYTVIMLVGVDKDSKAYVIDYVRDRMLPNAIINAIFDMYLKYRKTYHIRKVGIETVQYQKSMLYFIKDEQIRRGEYLPMEELKPDKDKFRRISALQPLFEQSKMFIRPTHVELEQELLEFPFSKHDDLPDALAYLPQLMKPGSNVRRKFKQITQRSKVTGY